MRNVNTIFAMVLACAIMLALVAPLAGGVTFDVLPEAEVEDAPDGQDFAHTRATHLADSYDANARSIFHGRRIVRGDCSMSLERLHILLI